MEQELAKFRAQKAQEYKSSKTKESIIGSFRPTDQVKKYFHNFSQCFCTVDTNLDKWILFLKIIFWLVLWKLFILLEFGTVFLMFSLFYWVYTSMTYGSRKPWEPSAYSVFNKDFETLEGTFTAEQFERELKFGAGSLSNN